MEKICLKCGKKFITDKETNYFCENCYLLILDSNNFMEINFDEQNQ